MKNITKTILILTCVSLSLCLAQKPTLQPTDLVTVPTAGLIPKGSYIAKFNLFQGGGLMGGISVGISDRFMIGVSYGGAQIVGNQNINWHNQPGIEVRYRFIEESLKFPGVLIGFTSQGFGEYIDTLKRYETKAKGFYTVASKNYEFFGNLGLHAGINYNPIEREDGDSDPSFFFGIDKNLNSEISVVAEYDAALNDNASNEISLGKGKGYLNAGIRWAVVENVHLEVDFNNILLNRNEMKYMNRELKISFIESF
jgi:hypothetical protein